MQEQTATELNGHVGNSVGIDTTAKRTNKCAVYVTQDGCHCIRGTEITPIGEPNRADVTGTDFRRSLQVGFALEKILPKGNEIKYNLRHILAVNSKPELYTLKSMNISAKISRFVREKSISFARKSRAKPPAFF